MNPRGSGLLFLVVGIGVLVVGIAVWYALRPVHSTSSRLTGGSASEENNYFSNHDCGTIDYFSYLRNPGQRTSLDIAALSCIDLALANCSPAHILLKADVNERGLTSTVMYGLRGIEANSCEVAAYALSTSTPREVCNFPPQFFTKLFSPGVVPGAIAFTALHVSLQLGKLADDGEPTLYCDPL